VNILFIHEIDWLRKVVFEIHTLSERLSLAGHRVYAIDYESMWVKESLFDFGQLRTEVVDKVARAYPDADVTLIRPGFIKIPGLSRVSAAFTHYRQIKRTIEEKKIDVIILYSVPTNGWQTVHLARKSGVPVVFRSIDILHQLVPYRILSAATGFMEKRIYPRVDLILTISPRLSRYVTGKGAAPDRVKLLLLGIDTKAFRPLPDNADIRSKWGFGQEDQIIEFIGTLYGFSGLDGLINQFNRVLEKAPQARLLIVGDGPQRPELEKIIAARGLNKYVVITGFQPYETMPRYINTAAVCINPFLITDVTRDIFPTKIVQYMACGKPVLATPLPGMKELVSGEEQGVLYAENADAMEEGIISLLESADYREKLGKAALNYVKREHDYDKIVQQLEAMLTELAAEKRNEFKYKT
jgi:glycosyltransferase involved in cell wall biosynthesis